MGEHGKGDVARPSVKGAHLILIQAHFAFGFLKTLLHRPAASNRIDHLVKGGAPGSKDQERGQLGRFASRGQTASHHQPAFPSLLLGLGDLDAPPIKEARSLTAIACRESLPLRGGELSCYLIDPLALALHLHSLLTGDRKSTRLNSSHANISYAFV